MKRCISCDRLKPKTQFHAHVHKSLYTGKPTTYINSVCIECGKLISKERRQSLRGMFTDMYNGQKRSSKTRNHPPPAYTQKELEKWVKAQPGFEKLFADWVISKYDRWLKPSCDRLDNTKPYTLCNIRLVTWKNNAETFKKDFIAGKETRMCRAVNQYDLHGNFIAQYSSIQNASRQTESAAANLMRCCKGEYKTSKGYIWRYADDGGTS